MASTRLMARTLATFFAFGGVAGLAVVSGLEAGRPQSVLAVLCLVALVAGAVVGRWGPSWPRGSFHATVGAAAAMIVTAVLLAPDPVTSLAAAVLISFVVVDAHFFFTSRQALAHLVLAVAGVTVALVLSDVRLGVAVGLDLVLTGIGLVIRRLVLLAATASRDPLTGLRNRRGFDDALLEAMTTAARTGEPLSAALLDLDHFKAVNDTEGHEAGDRLLCRVADAWPAELPSGAVLARHGGDEFSLVLPGTAGPDALALVRRVLDRHPGLALSCGVAEHSSGETASQLMRRTDRALYGAKAAGRGRAELDAVESPAGRAAPGVVGQATRRAVL
ncbi:hypothetical protein DQ241_05200 [Blastococcus sp. TF02A-30]|nr:hypothetical protein DQ241_05200 [Blastococcus sp. TF02A-30]